MAKARLSKLQKRILIRCNETLDRVAGWQDGCLYRYEIIDDYFKARDGKAEASTSRAIRSLIDKGLIIGFTPRVLSYGNKDLFKMLSLEKKPDLATLLQRQISKETQDQQQRWTKYNKVMDEYKKQYKPSEKLILPALSRAETIKVISLTKLGKEAVRCLMLSSDKKAELNNKS